MRSYLHKLNRYFEHQDNLRVMLIAWIIVVLLGVIDFFSGYELSFSLFYLLPVALVSWYVGREQGLVISIASAAIWLMANVLAGESFSSTLIQYWNTGIRLGFFLTVALLLSELRLSLEHERTLSRTDYLTGALNSRAFYELAEAEIHRSQRYGSPLTIVHIDLDNFKVVNDRFGHSVGDELLQNVVSIIKRNIRVTDAVARLGGDEFAVLLLKVDEESTRMIIPRLHQVLVKEMEQRGWPVTFSMGVLICNETPASVNEMLHQVDQLMYTVKNDGKDGVCYALYAPEPQAVPV